MMSTFAPPPGWLDPIAKAQKEDPKEVLRWIDRACSGEAEAQEAVFYHCAGPMFCMIQKMTQAFSIDEQEATTMKAMITLFEKLPDYIGKKDDGTGATLRTYAIGIARNFVYRLYRESKRLGRIKSTSDGVEQVPEEDDLEELEAQLLGSLESAIILEQLERLLYVGDWENGDEAHPGLSEQSRVILNWYFGKEQPLEALKELADLDLPTAEESLNQLRSELVSAVGGHEAWDTYDPKHPGCLEDRNRLLARALVRLIPELRVLNSKKYKLSSTERKVYYRHFILGEEITDTAKHMHKTRKNVDQIIHQIRTKAREARLFLETRLSF